MPLPLVNSCLTSVCRRELRSWGRRRSPRWWRWGGTQHGPAWHLLLPGLSYCWGKASKVRKRMFNGLYFIGNWVPGEWFKLGLLWVFCHPSRGGCVLSDIRKTVLASTVYTRIFPGFTDPNNRNFIYISVIFPSMLKALYLCPQYIFWDFPWVSPLIILVWGLSLGVILPSRIYTAAAADQAVTCGH